MKKRIISLLLVSLMLFTLLCGCGNSKKVLTQEEAIATALNDAKLESYDDAHAHVTTEDGVVCYSIHITVGETTYNYLIAAQGGKILSSGVE